MWVGCGEACVCVGRGEEVEEPWVLPLWEEETEEKGWTHWFNGWVGGWSTSSSLSSCL